MSKLSVCINTKDRHEKLDSCLKSIFNNSLESGSYQLVVVDQSDSPKKPSDKRVAYFKDNQRGTGKAKNLAISKATGSIIAFTDDDCIVDKNWLKNILFSFKHNKDIAGVFGQVLPYRPRFNKGKICPCTFEKKEKIIIKRPYRHGEKIGFGNNMAFRKEVFEELGSFREWLGPGSIGKNAEDAEFALRLLSKGKKILYNPRVKVYHHRWLTQEEFRKQYLSYSCGEIACYGYFAFQGLNLGRKVVINDFKDLYLELKEAIKSTLLLKRGSMRLFFCFFEELYYRLWGLVVGLYFSKKEPL